MADSDKRESILVVDDALDTLEILQRNLGSHGFRVYTSPNVPEAIRVLESTTVDLVITDLKMPKSSGLDLIRHIRELFRLGTLSQTPWRILPRQIIHRRLNPQAR